MSLPRAQPTAAHQLRLSLADPRSDPAWAKLMAGPNASLFGSPPWISAVADGYGFDPTANILGTPDQPRAGLATVEVNDLRGSRIISLPFSDFLDPVVGSSDEWQQLIDPFIGRETPLQLRVLHADEPRRDPRFKGVDELMWSSTDLTRPKDDVIGGFSANARRAARAARREGVTVTLGSSLDDVRSFHDLHRETRKRKYGLLAQPFDFFESIWRHFSPINGLAVGLAHHEGKTIAGGLYLFWNDVMYYKFGASRAEHLSLKPNDLLAAESVIHGWERGSARYDWGVSDLDQPGLVFFKRKYATHEGTVTVLRHIPPGHDATQGQAAGVVLGQLTEMLTAPDVPDDVTQRGGDLLYRYFC